MSIIKQKRYSDEICVTKHSDLLFLNPVRNQEIVLMIPESVKLVFIYKKTAMIKKKLKSKKEREVMSECQGRVGYDRVWYDKENTLQLVSLKTSLGWFLIDTFPLLVSNQIYTFLILHHPLYVYIHSI